MQTTTENRARKVVKVQSEKGLGKNKKPFLMNFVERKKVYSLSQQATTTCSYANGVTPDD